MELQSVSTNHREPGQAGRGNMKNMDAIWGRQFKGTNQAGNKKGKGPQMTTQHTAGNWTYRATATPDYARQYSVYEENSPRDIALVYDGEKAKANAALIAAAPCLLAALKEIRRMYLSTIAYGPSRLVAVMDAAISKAEKGE
jgi:hypothetical protein